MKVLVVYDSNYGNTEKIAKAIGDSISRDVKVLRASEVKNEDVSSADTLIVGSPTTGGRPTELLQGFLQKLPDALLKDKKIASFDTRYSGRFVKMFGYAADKIADSLVSKGGILISAPAPFIVEGKKGPLKDGELERAVSWAKGLIK